MEFRILGSMEVTDTGRRVHLPAGRARALLAVLLLHAGQPVPADRLIDELWGEHAPTTAATVIQGLVSRLRKTLEPDRPKGGAGQLLETVGAGYRLAIEPAAVDAHLFTRLVDQANEAPAQDRVRLLAQALDLWRGPALADFAYEPFAQRAIAALEERRIQAIERRFESELALGRAAGLVAELRTAIAAHPFREQLRAYLMTALYRSGRQAEALEAYRDVRAFLLEEMGLEPSPALRDLEAAILRQDPTLEPERTTEPLAREDASWLPRERRRITVVAVDLAPEADPDLDPETVIRAGDDAAQVATDTLVRRGGRVERSPGDQLTAFFGFPVAHEDDALRAVGAALELRTAVHRLNDRTAGTSLRYRARVGVESGEVVVGPGTSLADAVRGPVVSLAGRLQHAAGDAEILVGAGAQRLLRGAVILDPLHPGTGSGDKAWRVLEVVLRAQAIPRTFDAPMFGRQSELTRARSAFRRARRTNRVVAVAIAADPGLGKSRLAREVVATLGDEARAIMLRCPPPGDAVGFYPVRQAIVEAAGIHGWRWIHDALAELHDGTHIVPAVADAIALRSPPAVAAELLEPLRLLFEVLARQHPLVVVIEDLQWADAGFRAAVQMLADQMAAPVLLLCLVRPEAMQDLAASVEMMMLEPLEAGDIARLVVERAGSLPERSLRRIVELSQGNPLFAEQLLAAIDDDDLDAIPASLAGLLSMRLDRLGPSERDVLRVASIAGVDVEIDVVEAVMPPDARPFLHRHLESLEQRRLIERLGPRSFRFAHPLIQMAVYHAMTREDRTMLREAFADHLQRDRTASSVG